MKKSFSIWQTVATFSILISVVTSIGLIAMSESLIGIRAVVILISTLPLAYLLMIIRSGGRSQLLLVTLAALIYFCAGVMAMTTPLSETPLPLLYTLSVVLWFIGALMMIKTQ